MKSISVIIFAIFIFFVGSCTNGQTPLNSKELQISAENFSEKINKEKNPQVIDVRTPEEFSGGFIAGAINIDWNGQAFDDEINKLNKTSPVYVYCLSGARSASAAAYMRKSGFQIVYELKGGIMKWRAGGFPEITDKSNKSVGLTAKDYQKLISSNELVLINFYAEWCVPCKKMKPFMDELTKELKGKVEIIRIDADKNKELTTTLNVTNVPILVLYRNAEKVWLNEGYIDKEDIKRNISKW